MCVTLMDKKTILLIDDNLNTLALEKNLLECPEYIIKVTSSGEEAIEYIKNHTVDLIVLDFYLSDMSGYDFLELFHEERKNGHNARVMLMENITSKNIRKEFINMGVNVFYKKPVHDGFKELVHGLLVGYII